MREFRAPDEDHASGEDSWFVVVPFAFMAVTVAATLVAIVLE